MKRAVFVLIAALLVLLSYPSTDSLAGSSGKIASGPNIMPTRDGGYDVGLTGDSGGSDGDADDIGGYGEGGNGKIDPEARNNSGVAGIEIRTMIRIWWNFLIFIR